MNAAYLEVEDDQGGRYQVNARFYAAWPVESMAGEAEVLAFGQNQLPVVDSDTELPVIVGGEVGRGRVVLIGDSGFALNKNLEYVGGEPFAGRYENAHFWRWLISHLTGQPEWVPPKPATTAGTDPNDKPADEVEEGQ